MPIRRHNMGMISAGLVAMSAPSLAGGSAETLETGRPPAAAADTSAAKLSARDAGARYGQALGVVEVCIGSKVTATGNALGQSYQGADQEVFKAQAAKIYEAWHKVKSCSRALDPNVCKIIMDESCAAAEKEIGPGGTVLPGLVEFKKR